MHSRALPLILITAALFSTASFARDVPRRPDPVPTSDSVRRASDSRGTAAAVSASAVANTTVLYAVTFDSGGSCTTAGWTAVDMTAQLGDFFHVDDYAGLAPADFSPLAGTRSLWCGAREATGPLCRYLALPGYGNNWDQAFCTKDCIPVEGPLDVSFLMRVDSEAGYDAPSVEYTTACSGNGWWYTLEGGRYDWGGAYDTSIDTSYVVLESPVKVRIRFRSDGVWSDEDGLYETNGGVHIDDLQVEGLALEDFEDEASGATSADEWQSCPAPDYGIYAGLRYGGAIVQEDPCVRNISCVWNFFTGSTYYYGCNYFPKQQVVPYGNAHGQYLSNEIWSPPIALTGTGSELLLEFSVYRDIPLETLVFYIWHIRGVSAGCPEPWRDRNYVYYGGQKDWYRYHHSLGDLVDLASAGHVQLALGAIDYCGSWCGVVPDNCHTHAPLLDNVRLLRIDRVGPQWSIRDVDQFQDNFAGDGTLTGTVRADTAIDIAPRASMGSIVPGDSSVVTVNDPVEGLGIDPVAGGAAVYSYVSVWPQGQAAKSGSALSPNATRWPVVGTWTDASGVPWTCLRLDSVYANGVASPGAYCVDLNDNLFTPGDTVCFFYAARSANAVETYAFGPSLEAVGVDREVAALNAAEFTCLPAGGPARGGDILYVDGMDGRGAQPYWDTAFASLGLLDKVDRYDVRGPTSRLSNRPGGRVKDVQAQLAPYRTILWDCGDVEYCMGDGTGDPEKGDDWGLLADHLAALQQNGGVYVCGDNVALRLAVSRASGPAFKAAYIPFTLTTSNHRPAFGISPAGVPSADECYSDTFVISGGCPILNGFDVMTPSATSEFAIGYGTPATTNGAVLYKSTYNGTADVGVLLGGFSFVYISDDENDGASDRMQFLSDTLCKLGTVFYYPTPAAPPYVDALHQNFPNPFNPQTTIAFSLRQRSLARLTIYNVAGERVRTLAAEELAAGPHARTWDGRNDRGVRVSSGVYFYELVAGPFRETRKMVVLK